MSRNHPDRIQITFDDRRLANAGWGVARHRCPNRPAAPRPDAGRRTTLVALRLVEPMCCAPGGGTLAACPAQWGHVRLWLLARAHRDPPLTIDLDSTICETYGLAKEGARHHGYTGKRLQRGAESNFLR